MTVADTHVLTGAYALDALTAPERDDFEHHLAECATCRAEVAGFAGTAAILAVPVQAVPPHGLRTVVLDRIDVVRQLPPAELAPAFDLGSGALAPASDLGSGALAPASDLGSGALAPAFDQAVPARTSAERPKRRWDFLDRLRPALAPVAAALAIIVALLGGLTISLDERVGRLEQALQAPNGQAALIDVLAASDTQTLQLEAPAGVTARYVYSDDLDQAVLVAAGLERLPDSQTYELWLLRDGEATPAGLFDAADGRAVVAAVDGSEVAADGLAVTIEPAGGADEPTGEVVLRGTF